MMEDIHQQAIKNVLIDRIQMHTPHIAR
jgi:hypothetical protein